MSLLFPEGTVSSFLPCDVLKITVNLTLTFDSVIFFSFLNLTGPKCLNGSVMYFLFFVFFSVNLHLAS